MFNITHQNGKEKKEHHRLKKNALPGDGEMFISSPKDLGPSNGRV